MKFEDLKSDGKKHVRHFFIPFSDFILLPSPLNVLHAFVKYFADPFRISTRIVICSHC
jgi:hypothetical protein